VALAKPEATYTEDLHRFAWPDGFEMILERFNESKDDIACELTVHSAHPTRGGTLVDGKRLLLIGPNSQRDMKRTLEARDDGPDWGGMLEQATTLARKRYREGEPPTDLRGEFTLDTRYLVRPVVIDGGTTVWFGSEESAKSMTAMEVAVTVATGCEIAGFVSERTGPVLYLDWEDEADTHKERLRAICAGVGVDYLTAQIWHQRMAASLSESSRDVRKLRAKLGAVLVVVDSIGMASGGDPQDAGGIIRAMIAARSLGAPVLGIHHLPKDARDKSRPYGSVYAAAEARMTWLVEKDEDAPLGALRIAMTNKKSNRSARHPRLAFEFRFQTTDDREALETVTMAPIGFLEAVSIGSSGSQKWRIAALLIEPMTLEAIAEASGITKATVRMQLNRHKDLFVRSGDLWGRISDTNQGESLDLNDSGRIESVRAPLGALIRTGDTNRREEERPPWADEQSAMDDSLVGG
jgi:hypothetical protein